MTFFTIFLKITFFYTILQKEKMLMHEMWEKAGYLWAQTSFIFFKYI